MTTHDSVVWRDHALIDVRDHDVLDEIDVRTDWSSLVDPRLPRVSPHQGAGFYAKYGKEAFDRIVGAILLVVLSPIMLVVALAVLLQLGRPVLLPQARIGRGGEQFPVLKFRTMLPDRRRREVPIDGPDRRRTHKTLEDPRHTGLGMLLRKLSLDELPQLWNVVRGDMSLVGPRPEMVELVRLYSPWQHARHAVKPGITGLWQTTARAEGPMHEYIHLDLEYIRRISFATDLRLLWRTISVLLRPKAI